MSAYLNTEKVAIRVAKELENQGYAVVLAPSADIIPFSLEGYRPDLLATKSDEHLIIEIKGRSSSPEQAQQFRKVIDLVEAHPGWRFLIKTVADLDQANGETLPEFIGLDAIESYVSKADRIVHAGPAELAIPYLWNAVIALLRHKASNEQVSAAGLTDRSLINQLYTMGVISSSQYDKLVYWNQLRNSAVHSLSFVPPSQDVTEFYKFTRDLIEELKRPGGQSEGVEQISSAER